MRQGGRLITDIPAYAYIFRTLMIPIPPRTTDHRARYHGWNLEERWAHVEFNWDGQTYDFQFDPQQQPVLPSERPVVAFVGGEGDYVGMDFVQRDGLMAGSNILAGQSTPIRGIVEGLGRSASVLSHHHQHSALSLPSASLNLPGGHTALIVQAPDEVAVGAYRAQQLYGAYYNIVSASSMTAMFNGLIVPVDTELPAAVDGICRPAPPAVESADGFMAVRHSVDNAVAAPRVLVFYEDGAKAAKLTEQEAVDRLVALSEDTHGAVAEQLVKAASSLHVAGSSKDVASLFK